MAATQCQQCGAELPADAPGGVCPYCVLQLAGGEGSGWHATSAYSSVPTLPSMEELAALFPQLEILEPIGRGGMGAVYKARQPSLDRLVALKILLPDIGRDPTFAERFSREARALARLNHPHIVSVYDSGQLGGLYYFVMEYVDGVNLRQAIQAEQITPDKALAIVPQICEALQYAHEEGVVHRDIKPENVLLDRKGRVKVADFGLAKLLGLATPDISLTGTRQAMGTLHYMAPEQYEKPQSVDHRADIYSLGVVFYELLTGKLPLGRFALPSEKVQVDARLDDVVLKSMEREPDRRYQYVSEVKTEMDSIAQSPAQAAPQRPTLFAAGRAMHAPPPRAGREEVLSRPPPAPLQETSDFGRLLILLGILALAALPLLCGGLALLTFLSGSSPVAMWLPVLLLPVLLICGVVMISLGLSTKQRVEHERSIPPEKTMAGAAAREQAEQAVRWPALALLILAVVDCVPVGVVLLATGGGVALTYPWILSLLQVGIAIVIGIGASRMRNLQSYGMAMTAAILAVLPVHLGWFLGIPLGIWALAVLSRSDVRRAFGVGEAGTSRGDNQWGAPLLVGLLVVPVMLVGILICGTGYLSTTVVTRPAPAMYPQAETSPPVNVPAIKWVDDRPRLDHAAWVVARLGANQAAMIDEVLAKNYDAFLLVEKEHIQRKTNDEGQQVVTIEPFPKELARLENDFWTEVDKIVHDDRIRGELREQLPRSALFPHGQGKLEVAIWKVGAWYYYKNPRNHEPSHGPELPPSLKRLWQPPENVVGESLEAPTRNDQ